MAYLKLDQRTGNWFVRFRYGGIQYKRSCRTTQETRAKRIQSTVDETIGLLHTGRLVVPDDIDPATWIVSGGKAEAIKIKQSNADGRFGSVCDAYFKAQHQKAKGTLQGEVIHIRRWKKFVREHTLLRTISLDESMNVSCELFEGVLSVAKRFARSWPHFAKFGSGHRCGES